MDQQPSKRTFEGLMNADDAPEALAPNEYINAENIRFGGHLHGKSLRGELIESNRIIENASLPEGTNIQNGKIEDTERDRIIYLLYNTLGNHSIAVFDQRTETFIIALHDADVDGGLQFSYDRYIHSIDLVGDLLYWVDYPMPQRRINIEAALKANNSGYSITVLPYSLPVSYNVTLVIRKPGNYPIQAAKIEDGTIQVNQIKNTGFRFAYRYVYRDGETSTISMQSALVPPNWKGEEFNAIEITLPLAEAIDQDVLIVELIVFYAEDEKAFVIHRWDKRNDDDATAISDHNTGTALTHIFSNNTIGTAIDVDTKIKAFDSVPNTSASQAVIKNRLFYGRNTVGYDSPTKTSMQLVQVEIADTNLTKAGEFNLTDYTHDYTESTFKFLDLYDPSGLWPDFTYNSTTNELTYTGSGIGVGKMQFSFLTTWVKYVSTSYTFNLRVYKNGVILPDIFSFGGGVITAVPTTQTVTGLIDVALATGDVLKFELQGLPTGGGSNFNPWELTISGPQSFVTILENTGNAQNGLQVNKSDAAITGGMLFFDEHMRQCGVVTNDGIIYTSPDRTYAGASDYNYLIQWLVSNTSAVTEIPIWAYYYAPVFSKNLRTDFFLQSRVSDISYCTKAADGSYTGLGTTNTFTQGLAGLAVKADLLFGYGLGYAYGANDVLKIYIGASVYDAPVKAVQGDWIIAEPIDVGDTTSALALFELFTPKQNNADALFFEVGQICPVSNPGTSSRAYSVLSGNVPPDCYLVSRKDADGNNYYVEAMNPNDANWRRWLTSHGRVQVVNSVGQQPVSLVWSDTYLNGSFANGLSSFWAFNTYMLDGEYGSVQKLVNTIKTQQDGSVLLGICEDETVTMYIGERQVFDASGSSSLIKTDEVIGQVNKLAGSKGTRHPESVSSRDNFVLWFDVVRGAVVQYSQAGLYTPSDYKMKRFWKSYADAYAKLPSTWWTDTEQRDVIIGEIDEYNKEYLLSIPAVNEIPGLYPTPFDPLDGKPKVMVYQIGAQKWKGSYTYIPEGFAYLNNVLYTFKNGELYAHDVKDNLLRFYGVTHKAKLMIAETAGDYDATKVWRTVSIVGNKAPEYLLAMAEYPYPQETDLYGNQFKPFEGKLYAPMLRNKFTPGMVPAVALMRGEMMRGQVLYVCLEFYGNGTETERIYINSIHFGVVLSKGHTV